MNVEQFIRDSAANGLSKTQTREALDMCTDTFYEALQHLGELPWAPRGQSLGHKLSNQARRGHCSPALRTALAESRARRKALHTHTLRGVSGTVEELVQHFPHSVSASTIRRRLAKGLDIESAFFNPTIKPFQGPNHATAWT